MNQQTFNYKPRPGPCGAPVQFSFGRVAGLLILLLSAYAVAQYVTDLGDRQAKARELEHYRAKLRELNACQAKAYAYPIMPPAPAKRSKGGGK